MVRRVHCEKKTKIYIPKISNPQILTCKNESAAVMSISDNKETSEKRR